MPSWLVISIIVALMAVATLIADFIVRQFSKREKRVERRIEHLYAVADDQFARIMANLLPRSFAQDNKVTPLRNDDQIFPSMLHAIRSAQHTIAFETFIY
jgi:cardiolipin synthase A/B